MYTLTRDALSLDGFAGLRERLYVMDSRRFGDQRLPDSSEGLGQLVYLADAIFLPHGSTRAHEHSAVDIISVVVRGRVRHEGSLGDGEVLEAGDVQVQYAGAYGFRHNEINPNDSGTHMIQLWLQPRRHEGPPRYRVCRPAPDERTAVYGKYSGDTRIDVWRASAGRQAGQPGRMLGYLVYGSVRVTEGEQTHHLAAETLFIGDDLILDADSASLLLLVHEL
ncbi:pirin-related protein [Isoalcanivorax pacificus W11-5]|uniref:Pirin-related protein n=1 Tax=Isoalcanivorax pacificus W11-5 TaxID=391936 RepID=A0A0B4XN96_9GAMM|nr:pirin family protein [Isoalcanivorax pacificus]AJD47782.1 pirin-related protein [Isoalcanivorax pacificus W11-5]